MIFNSRTCHIFNEFILFVQTQKLSLRVINKHPPPPSPGSLTTVVPVPYGENLLYVVSSLSNSLRPHLTTSYPAPTFLLVKHQSRLLAIELGQARQLTTLRPKRNQVDKFRARKHWLAWGKVMRPGGDNVWQFPFLVNRNSFIHQGKCYFTDIFSRSLLITSTLRTLDRMDWLQWQEVCWEEKPHKTVPV